MFMTSNLDKYKNDLNKLVSEGELLSNAIQYECLPEEFESQVREAMDEDQSRAVIKNLPIFKNNYQGWYSESLVIIKIMLPDRLDDFIQHYEKPKGRKEIGIDTYVIEDYLQGISVWLTYKGEDLAGPSAAIPQFQQQLNILKSVQKRFESSLFDIKQLVQADLFDSELEAAEELNKNGFIRGAGAVAGVVIEKHLEEVCNNHEVKTKKKNPTINDLNQNLKDSDIIDTKTWRFIQRLADLRNLCDHNKKKAPTKEDVDELISGVSKISKTIF